MWGCKLWMCKEWGANWEGGAKCGAQSVGVQGMRVQSGYTRMYICMYNVGLHAFLHTDYSFKLFQFQTYVHCNNYINNRILRKKLRTNLTYIFHKISRIIVDCHNNVGQRKKLPNTEHPIGRHDVPAPLQVVHGL